MLMYLGMTVANFLSQIDACKLNQLVNQSTHLHGHILDLILTPNGQHGSHEVKMCEFVSDHVVIKCSIDFPCPKMPKITYQRYHHIDMDALRTDLQNTPFVNKLANLASALYNKQYVHKHSQ